MKRKLLVFLTVLAAVTGGVLVTRTFADDAAAASGRTRIFDRIADKLDLSPEQETQFKQIFSAEKDTVHSLVTQLHDARLRLRDAIHADHASEASVRAASAKVASVEADMAVERLKLYTKIAPLLTDEQRAKLAELEQHLDELVDHVIAGIGEAPTS